jgi:hypothetical protein
MLSRRPTLPCPARAVHNFLNLIAFGQRGGHRRNGATSAVPSTVRRFISLHFEGHSSPSPRRSGAHEFLAIAVEFCVQRLRPNNTVADPNREW